MDDIFRHDGLSFVVIIPAGVQVAVKAREIAAGDFKADAVAREKVIAGCVQVDSQGVYFSGFHPDFSLEALAITRAQDAVLQVERSPGSSDLMTI